MYISPPVSILVILALGLATSAWIEPPRETTPTSVMLPGATYKKLALWANEHAGENGRPLSVAQVIEELASRMAEQ